MGGIDTADVGAVEVGAFGEFFLREVLRLPARATTSSGLSPNFQRAPVSVPPGRDLRRRTDGLPPSLKLWRDKTARQARLRPAERDFGAASYLTTDPPLCETPARQARRRPPGYVAASDEAQFATGRQIRGPAVACWAMARQAEGSGGILICGKARPGRETGPPAEKGCGPFNKLREGVLPYCGRVFPNRGIDSPPRLHSETRRAQRSRPTVVCRRPPSCMTSAVATAMARQDGETRATTLHSNPARLGQRALPQTARPAVAPYLISRTGR